jgi:hypothetical protein
MCAILSSLHSLTGCNITGKMGTKKRALMAKPFYYLESFGSRVPPASCLIQQAEEYLVNVVDPDSIKKTSVNFDQICFRSQNLRYTNFANIITRPETSHQPCIFQCMYHHACSSQPGHIET